MNASELTLTQVQEALLRYKDSDQTNPVTEDGDRCLYVQGDAYSEIRHCLAGQVLTDLGLVDDERLAKADEGEGEPASGLAMWLGITNPLMTALLRNAQTLADGGNGDPKPWGEVIEALADRGYFPFHSLDTEAENG